MGDADVVPEVVVTGASSAETSPLLGTGAEPAPNKSNGTFEDRERSAEDQERVDGTGEATNDGSIRREGMPEVAAKMPVLLPAISVGVFLCAIDQLLAVATYAKIGSDLNALNNTSWIAAA